MSAQITPPPQPAKRHGCFFYGCITVLILMVLLGVGGFFLVRYTLHRVIALAEQYTETQPMTLPQVQMSTSDYDQLDKRVTEFNDRMKAGKPVPPLILSGDEINALIGKDPAWRNLKGKLYVTIEGDRIKGQISVPLDEFATRVPGLSRLKGRYLNGEAALKVSLENGPLNVTLQSLEIKGQSPPLPIMTQLQSVNFAQNASQDPRTADVIGKLESITVGDGKLTIKTKAKE